MLQMGGGVRQLCPSSRGLEGGERGPFCVRPPSTLGREEEARSIDAGRDRPARQRVADGERRRARPPAARDPRRRIVTRPPRLVLSRVARARSLAVGVALFRFGDGGGCRDRARRAARKLYQRAARAQRVAAARAAAPHVDRERVARAGRGVPH